MPCQCNIVGLLSTSIQGIFSASIDGSTSIEVSENGTVLLGSTVSNLTIGAYAFLPGQDRFLGASCPFSANATVPWVTKEDCATGTTYFIPRAGGSASVTNLDASGVNKSIIDLDCSPGIISRSFEANAGGGPAAPYFLSDREDGYNLVYTGTPIAIESGKPQMYTISLGFVGSINAFLQSFSLTINPPEPARVNYSFAFSGVVL
jgi:hypothetical protein